MKVAVLLLMKLFYDQSEHLIYEAPTSHLALLNLGLLTTFLLIPFLEFYQDLRLGS